MTNPNLDESITFDNVVPKGANATENETKVVGADLGERLRQSADYMPSVQDEHSEGSEPKPNADAATEATTESNTESYDGPGVVITKEQIDADKEKNDLNLNFTGIAPDTQANIDAYMADMDSEIAELKEFKEKAEAEKDSKKAENDSNEDSDDDNEKHEEFNEKYDSAVVIIDKSGFGNVINFTDDERAKLERARKIKVEEVETLSLGALKTKKPQKKADFDKVIKKKADFNSTNIVLPVSGYTATISGCSAYELISLIEPVDENPLMKTQNKWSVIHSKIESTSIGKMDFDEFLKNTAASDYETLIYGILCSTYPDDDKIDITCEKCNKTFEHKYSVRSLIRVEKMSEDLQDTIMKTVDASAFVGTAKDVHAAAAISNVKRIKLPMSEIIVDIYVQSAYDLIKKRAAELAELNDEKYQPAAVLSTLIRTAYVYDESDDSYFEIDDSIELAKLVYSLSEVDVMVINRIADELIAGKTIEYGLMDVNCPFCRHHRDTIDISLDDMLFQRYRQALSTTVE